MGICGTASLFKNRLAVRFRIPSRIEIGINSHAQERGHKKAVILARQKRFFCFAKDDFRFCATS